MLRAILFDLDGTIYEDGVELPGASAAVARLRAQGLQVGFVTNTTSRSRRLLTERLRGMRIATEPEQVVTALRAGAAHLKATLLGPSQAIPVKDGKLLLGTWQGITLVELDGPRKREIIVDIRP